MTKLYCLSGLGTDERAFKNIGINNVELIHIPWIDPLPSETLSQYAKRLFDITQPEEEYNLLGLSFGGMIAAEWEKIRAPKQLFLLSTISDKSKLPWFLKLSSALRLHRIIPMSWLATPNSMNYYFFGIPKNENREVFKDILRDTDKHHLRWATNAIVNWSNKEKSKGIRIHGDKDRLLPIKEKVDYIIPNAGHMAVLNNAEAIQKILEQNLRPTTS